MKFLTAAVALAATCLLLPAVPATAQSSAIGFKGAALSIGTLSGDAATSQIDGSLDIAITAQHGLQLDLGAIDYGNGWFGSIAGHLYLQPSARSKYGLFLAYADANDTEAATTEIGIEGLWSLGENATLSARAGLGRADPSEIDYIFASLGGSYALTQRSSLQGSLLLLDADESAASYTLAELQLGVAYALASAPVELYAGINHQRISGSLETSETRISLGLTAWIGQPRTARAPARTRRFAPVRPLSGLIARDAIWPGMARP